MTVLLRQPDEALLGLGWGADLLAERSDDLRVKRDGLSPDLVEVLEAHQSDGDPDGGGEDPVLEREVLRQGSGLRVLLRGVHASGVCPGRRRARAEVVARGAARRPASGAGGGQRGGTRGGSRGGGGDHLRRRLSWSCRGRLCFDCRSLATSVHWCRLRLASEIRSFVDRGSPQDRICTRGDDGSVTSSSCVAGVPPPQKKKDLSLTYLSRVRNTSI